MSVIKSDSSLCQGYANCMVEAPDFFDLGDDDKVLVLRSDVPSDLTDHVRTAALSCPARALRVEEA